MTQISVKSKELNAEVGIQWVAEEIEAIAESVKRLGTTRVTEKLLVTLIHEDTGISKTNISGVLKSLDNLEAKFLKPKKAGK